MEGENDLGGSKRMGGQVVTIPLAPLVCSRCRQLGRPSSHQVGSCAAARDNRGTICKPKRGGDARLPARAAPSRGQLWRALGRDPTEGWPAMSRRQLNRRRYALIKVVLLGPELRR